MPSPPNLLTRRALLCSAALAVGACVYRIDIQQGNLLEEEAIDQVEPGMTRSQVRFLLGTPMVADTFHQDRWDYMYYYRRGRSRRIQRRWAVVTFQEDKVVEVRRDVPVNPS